MTKFSACVICNFEIAQNSEQISLIFRKLKGLFSFILDKDNVCHRSKKPQIVISINLVNQISSFIYHLSRIVLHTFRIISDLTEVS